MLKNELTIYWKALPKNEEVVVKKKRKKVDHKWIKKLHERLKDMPKLHT